MSENREGSLPPVLDRARLLRYVVIDNSIEFSGRSLLSLDGKELGEVDVSLSRLTIGAETFAISAIRDATERSRLELLRGSCVRGSDEIMTTKSPTDKVPAPKHCVQSLK